MEWLSEWIVGVGGAFVVVVVVGESSEFGT